MINKTDFIDKAQRSIKDKTFEEVETDKILYGNSASQNDNTVDPMNLRTDITKQEKMFEIFNSNVITDGESPRVKTAISHKDFMQLYNKKEAGSRMSDIMQNTVPKSADQRAVTAIKDAMPTMQRRTNPIKVGEIQQKRRLENILNR